MSELSHWRLTYSITLFIYITFYFYSTNWQQSYLKALYKARNQAQGLHCSSLTMRWVLWYQSLPVTWTILCLLHCLGSVQNIWLERFIICLYSLLHNIVDWCNIVYFNPQPWVLASSVRLVLIQLFPYSQRSHHCCVTDIDVSLNILITPL